MAGSFWRNQCIDYSFISSIGASGGLDYVIDPDQSCGHLQFWRSWVFGHESVMEGRSLLYH